MLAAAALCTLPLCSCDSDKVYHNYVDVNMWGWNTTDTLFFTMPDMIETGEMEVFLCVRTTAAFNNKTLHLLTTINRDDVEIHTDTIFIPIYDSKGRTLGKGFPYTTTIKTMPTLHVDSGHVYKYCISHTMNEPEIKGIASVGLEMELNR